MGWLKKVGRELLFDGKGSREWLKEKGAQLYKRQVLAGIDEVLILLAPENIDKARAKLYVLRDKVENDAL